MVLHGQELEMHTLQMLGGILWHVCGACETLSSILTSVVGTVTPRKESQKNLGESSHPREDRAVKAGGQTEARNSMLLEWFSPCR